MRSIVNVFPRSVADGGGEVVYELPGWAIPVLLLNFIVFIPLYFYVSRIFFLFLNTPQTSEY